MATIAQIRADLVGSSASFRAAMIDGQRQANASLSAIRGEVASTAESIGALNKAAAGFIGFEAVKVGVQNLVDAQKAAQQIHYSLLSATGSTTAADAAYKQVSATAEHLGLDLQSSALGFSSMSAAANANGVSMKDQIALFDGLARSSTVLHLSSDQTGRAITALSQIFGKGKIQAEELRGQLGDAIPGVVPRFQTAVMAITKGTDLAGKSFDQLLQAGDLTVQRFLPALVQAFNETGKGAEQAAGGLNASINRLSTEWFKLKSDLSGGLFSDAAIGSIDLVAHNLENLAGIAGVTGGIVVARLAGGGLSSAAGSTQRAYQENVLGARMAAEAEAEYAKAQVASAAAEVRSNEAALGGVTSARSQALAQRDAAAATLQKALAENEAAQATLNHQRTAATLSANIRAQRIATADAAAAQAALTRAQVQYNASAQASVALKAQQIELESALFRARGAATIATEAEVAAERQLAATGAAGLLARGAAGAGNFALSLVGGPWGAVVASIGAVGYAFYELNQRSEDYRKETDEQVKSIQQMREQLQAAVKDYGSLHDAMSLTQNLDTYTQSTASLLKQRDEIAQLEQEAAKLQDRIDARNGAGAGGGAAVADWFDARKLEEVRDRIRDLNEQLPATQQTVDALGAKLAGSFAPSIDAVKGAIDRLRSGANLGDILSGWSADINTALKNVDAARQKAQQIQGQLQANTQTLTTQAATDGMNNAQQQQYLLRQALEQIKAQKLSPEDQRAQIAEVTATAAPAIQAGAQKDAADAAKKAAAAATSQAKEWQQQADTLNRSLQQTHNELAAQLDSTQKLTPAEKQLQDIVGGTDQAYNRATAAQKARLLALAQSNAELSKSILLQQQEAAAATRTAALSEQLAARIARQNEANDLAVSGVGHGQELTQQLQDELRIRQEYDRQRQQYDKQAAQLRPGVAGAVGTDAYNGDVARMLANQQQELALYRAGVQQRLDAEQDWVVGARAAFEDYASSARDKAGQAQQAISNGFRTLEDDAVDFAMTGKASFKDFANSVISDFIRIQLRAQESGILNMLTSSYLPIVSGSENSAALSSSVASGLSGYKTDVTSVSDYLGTISKGGRAAGGSVDGGSLYEVAEGGKPELLQSGGRTYLMTGANGGAVSPASRDSSVASAATASSAPTVNVHLNGYQGTPPEVTHSTDSQGNLDVKLEFNKMIDARMNQNLANRNSQSSKILQSVHGVRGRGTPVSG